MLLRCESKRWSRGLSRRRRTSHAMGREWPSDSLSQADAFYVGSTLTGLRYDRSRSSQVFARRSNLGWPRVRCPLPTHVALAVRLDLARRSLGLSDDDRRYLRHTWCVLDPGRT